MKHDKRSAHFGRDRTGTRWCASDFLAEVTGRTYHGQPVCARCGWDEFGFHWPNCTSLAAGTRGWPIHAAIRRTMHELSCARYWRDGGIWTCAECDADMAKEETT